jgi:hypothetical protein
MEDLEQKDTLEKLLRLTEENNNMLRQMRRRARWGTIFRIIYWVLIIGLSVGAFYFIQPYINGLVGNISEVQSQVEMFRQFVN